MTEEQRNHLIIPEAALLQQLNRDIAHSMGQKIVEKFPITCERTEKWKRFSLEVVVYTPEEIKKVLALIATSNISNKEFILNILSK